MRLETYQGGVNFLNQSSQGIFSSTPLHNQNQFTS